MASVSKRQQARNERELQELLRLPGNSQCADCGARNPGWASWSLGIFVCMRCASIHRKLGTHISKVKSLSMDTWNTEQVENMKRTGNTAANKIYNPKNRRPDIPLDADEVDSAMERFIRKKYQEKSLAEGRPEPPRRNESSPPVPPKSPENSPPRPVASKKGRFFGFGLRASSSAYPLSKHDKKKLPPEPRVESAWTIDSDRMGGASRMDDAAAPMSESELQRKLVQLRDMGFGDTERNTNMLRRLNGDFERTIDALVQLGPGISQRTSSAKVASQETGSSRGQPTVDSRSAQTATRPSPTSTNPFNAPSGGQGFGISMVPPQLPQSTGASYGSNNPYEQQMRGQTEAGLSQALGGFHISQPIAQPLFPNSTGGYAMQQPQLNAARFQTMTPPIPSIPQQQYGYAASPAAMPAATDPFFQPPQQYAQQHQIHTQMTGSNPFFSQTLPQPPLPQQAPMVSPTNPFMTSAPPQPSTSQAPGFNPFGIPPPQQSPPPGSQGQLNMQPVQTGYQPHHQVGPVSPANPFQQSTQAKQFPTFAYGQPPPPQEQQQSQQTFASSNPYASLPQSPPEYPNVGQPATLMPQQTGRYDKQSILALYNYPQLAPAKFQGLSSIPEPPNENVQQQGLVQPKRSVTMPVAMGNMHSAGGAGMSSGNRNPFMQNMSPQQSSPPPGIMARHVSQESYSINNLETGRHSPDAFANLSARYVR